jgi:hypothetical protein
MLTVSQALWHIAMAVKKKKKEKEEENTRSDFEELLF